MGVVGVGLVLSSEYWASEKPAEYKGTSLDKALQAWGMLANKTVKIPQDLIPAPPDCKVRALDKYVTELKAVLKELDTAKELVNKYITVLKAVQAAGGSASAELTKMSKGKDSKGKELDDEAKQKYTRAAGAASSIAASAAGELKNYE